MRLWRFRSNPLQVLGDRLAAGLVGKDTSMGGKKTVLFGPSQLPMYRLLYLPTEMIPKYCPTPTFE